MRAELHIPKTSRCDRSALTGTCYLVTGLCATGRTTAAAMLGELFWKLSTRRARPDDPGILSCTAPTIACMQARGEILSYACGGHEYVIDLLRLDAHLLTHNPAAVIVSDHSMIPALRGLYPSVAMPSVFLWASPWTIQRRLREAGCTDVEIDERMVRSAPVLAAFQEHPELYDAVLINEFDRETLARHVRALQTKLFERKETLHA